MSVNSKMTAIADPIRTLMGATDKMGLDAMASNLGEVVNECDTQADLITQIKTALADKAAGGVELPTLTNPGSASDLAQDKQLIGADGSVVDGNVYVEGVVWSSDLNHRLNFDDEYGTISVGVELDRDILLRKGSDFYSIADASDFGNATEDDVRQGKTFTSAAGVLKEGKALLPGGGFIYPDGAFAPVTSFADGKQYALVATINGVRRYLNTTTFNNWTMNATEIAIAEDEGDYVLFSATPALFTAVESGNGFLLKNGNNYLNGNDNSGSALRVDTNQAVWTVDTSASAGLEEGKYNPKEDPNAVWLFTNYKNHNWTIKFEANNNSFGFDRNGRDSANSTGYVSFVLYEYVAGEGEVSPIVDTSDANVTADKMLAGYSGYANGRKVNGGIELQSKTVTANGTVTPDEGKFLSSVVVNVPTGSTGATVASKTIAPTANSTSVSFTGLTARPKMFSIAPKENISFSTSNRFVVNVMYDGTTTHGMYVVGSGSFNASYTGTYSATYFTWTYSNGTLTVTTSSATNGGYFASGVDYQLTYVV